MAMTLQAQGRLVDLALDLALELLQLPPLSQCPQAFPPQLA